MMHGWPVRLIEHAYWHFMFCSEHIRTTQTVRVKKTHGSKQMRLKVTLHAFYQA